MSDSEYTLAAKAEFAAEDQAKAMVQALSPKLVGEFDRAVIMRRDTEQRWLEDLRQYRGQYNADQLAKMVGRSSVFVRKTRVKVKTIDSRVADLLFPAGSEKNWEIGPTPKPMIGKEQREEIKQQMLQAAAQLVEAQKAMKQAQGGQPQGPNAAPPPGAFAQTPQADAMQQQMPPQQMPPEPTDEQVDALVAEFVAKAAKKMSTAIDDQLTECRYKDVCVRVVHSGHLYGTGVMKGPMVERKVRTRFTKVVIEKKDPLTGQPTIGADGQPERVMKWQPQTEYYTVPFVEYVPLWRFYPDMSATEIEDCRYVWERHFMSRSRMVELGKRKSFRGDLIKRHLQGNPDGSRSNVVSYDNDIRDIGDRNAEGTAANGTYEVRERWGYLTGAQLKEAGYAVDDSRLEDDFFSNVWMLHNGEIIKVSLSPIDGTTWPYHLYHFDKDETSIFGEGLASVMRHDQAMLNASVRLMLDNAAITSGPQLEINVDLLAKGEKVDEIIPWKVWKRNGQHPERPAIRSIELPNQLEWLTKMAALFESNADEVTAIPRYMSGENATQGAAGTAAGMSMLMAAANIVIKDLITAWDEGVTRPFLQALYHWNMKYNPDDSIKGDFDVKARGTASLVAKEVRARSLNEFSAMVSNPMDAPYVKRHNLLRQRAEALELNDIVMTEDEFKEAQNSPEAKAQKELQMGMAQMQLDELKAKVALANKNSELIGAKVEAMVAEMKIAMEESVVGMVEKTVSTIYAALQAGQVATRDPFAAPAADEILRSSGFKDKTPNPSIADLNSQPVQQTDGEMQLMQKGQSFAEPQRTAQTTNEAPTVNQPEAAPPQGQPAPDLKPQTGMVGERQGIETVAND